MKRSCLTAGWFRSRCRDSVLLLAWGVGVSLLVIGGNAANGAEPPDYNRDIRPLLAEHCFACHGADAASRQADLRLDQRDSAVARGAISSDNPQASTLLERIFSTDAELIMPPPETKKTLTPQQKELLQQWVTSGAEYQSHWAFQPPQKVDPPTVERAEWNQHPIDRMIFARLQAAGLEPAPRAEPQALYRRLHLDITGLPPRPEQTDAFVKHFAEQGESAWEAAIDELLQSPGWGEHRARYWLDAARYGDTHGLHFDNYREMWPYRDWVIRAFNANQPFDQFTIEQLAGDLLPNPTESQLVATGLQRCNITTNEGGTIDEENLALYASDRVQTFGWIYLGLTTNCSQCHDHKFDPISQKDYYSLAAFFRNTTQGPKDGNIKDGRGPFLLLPSDQDRPRWEQLPAEIEAAKRDRDHYRQQIRPAFETWLAAATPALLDADLPTQDLAVHLPLNEGTGNTVTSALDPSQTFTASGELTWLKRGTGSTAPQMKSGVSFDLGSAGDFEKDQAFSYGAWIRAGRDNVSGAILARMDEKAGHRGWDLYQQGKSLAAHLIDHWSDNALKVSTRDAVLKPGQWQHVFVTYDGSAKLAGLKIYVDGKLQPLRTEANSLKPEASIRTETPLKIGQRSHGVVFDEGALQDLRIYARELSAVEVQALAEDQSRRDLLAKPADKRKPEEVNTLFEYFLTRHDTQYPPLAAQVTALEAEQEAIRGRSPITHIQKEREDSPAMAHVLIRGEYDRLGEQVPALPPAALHPLPEGAPQNRLGLAQWVVDPANPLTARVTVNRFWQEIFGQGIVVTPEDFGIMGALPTHPELLDWLAVDFQEHGWDVKRFYKQIFLSETYRQAAITTPKKQERDRDNLLLSRGPRFRMDAEMLRDHALATSGLLSAKMYGPGVRPYQPNDIWNVVGLPGADTRNYVQDTGENLYRRTIYSFWKRMAHPPNLDALNAPSREVCVVRRERTNTPLQALVTLNDPQFFEAARVLAQQVLQAEATEEPTAIVDHIGRRVLSRAFHSAEREILLQDFHDYQEYYSAHPDQARELISVGAAERPDDISPATLAAWTLVCNQVHNLDEALNK